MLNRTLFPCSAIFSLFVGCSSSLPSAEEDASPGDAAVGDAALDVDVGVADARADGGADGGLDSSDCFNTVVNGQSWPASCRLYGADSPWNQEIKTDTPTLFPSSDAIIASHFAHTGDQGFDGLWTQNTASADQYDYDHPIYVAAKTDPLVTYQCKLYCGSSPGELLSGGQQFRIPAAAMPAGGTDHHLYVIQPNGDEYDFWGVTANSGAWKDGDTFAALSGQLFADAHTSSGWVTSAGAGATASGASEWGEIRASELEAGVINHALALVTGCEDPGEGVFPSMRPTSDHPCSFSPALPYGARVWSDLTDAEVNGNVNLTAWEKTILIALHHYGAYNIDGYGDGTDGSMGLQVESSAAYVAFGVTNPLYQLFKNLGASYVPSLDRYILGDPWTPNVSGGLPSHLHVVDVCYAKGTC